MDIVFIIALLFLLGCIVFRKKLTELFADRKEQKKRTADNSAFTAYPEKSKITDYTILAFNARDYATTKDLEDMMETRLQRCLAGLAKEGVEADVEFYSTGFVLVYLIRYTH